jgi:hypothetical protein
MASAFASFTMFSRATLDSADVIPVQTGAFGKLFL